MKRHSINRWIVRCFAAILAISFLLTAAVNYMEAYTSSIQLGMERARVCANSLTHLLKYQWTLEELRLSTESEIYQRARKTFRNLCLNYQLDSLYLYTIDPGTGSRYYILGAFADEARDEALADAYGLKTETPAAFLPGEEALLSGAGELQEAERRDHYGDVFTWLAPNADGSGALRAVVGMDYSISWIRRKTLHSFLMGIIPFLISILAGFLILLIMVRRRIVNPLHTLSDSMRVFSRNSREKPEPLHITQQDEIGEIAATYEKMTGDISDYLRSIESLTRKQTEIDVQLDVARKIQYGLVPERTNLSGAGYRISALTHPAKAVGGDFYDCFQRSQDCVCVFIGDVSGKGISAALYMAVVRTMIREKLMAGFSPAESLNQVNDSLCAENPEGLFVTVFAALLNPRTGQVCYANAGHTLPVLLGEDIRLLRPESGVVLGVFESIELEDYSLTFAPGEGILLYTDGVTEAINPKKEFFQTDRLLAALEQDAGSTDTEGILCHISRAVYDFCDGEEPFDDMAVLALCRK